jgi:hypothetical protein
MGYMSFPVFCIREIRSENQGFSGSTRISSVLFIHKKTGRIPAMRVGKLRFYTVCRTVNRRSFTERRAHRRNDRRECDGGCRRGGWPFR